MDLRKFLFLAAAIALAIGLAMISVFAIIAGVMIAIALRAYFWLAKPKTVPGAAKNGMGPADEEGMIDITSKGKVL